MSFDRPLDPGIAGAVQALFAAGVSFGRCSSVAVANASSLAVGLFSESIRSNYFSAAMIHVCIEPATFVSTPRSTRLGRTAFLGSAG